MDEIPETRDSLLIRVADARDQAAWEQFARIYRPVVYNVARMRGLQDADTPEWLERVIQRLLAKSLDDRIQTAEHIANLLQRCLAHLQQPMNVELPEEFRMQKHLRGFMSVSKKITRTVAAIALSTLVIAVVYFVTRLQPSLTAESKSTQIGEISFSEAAAREETSLPESEAEKAIARMVLVFSQDQARRAVPGLMIDHGAETLILTTGPATIVPDGVAHATSRTYLEFPETVDVEAEFIDTKTADVFFHRAKSGLTTFKLEKTVDLEVGDGLSAILLSGQPTLRVTPKVARISALNQATTFSLSTHKFSHEFTGLIQLDQRIPEGTPLFKDGQLAGITLLGTRFMKDDVPGSYVVPTSRLFEVLRQVKTE